MRKLTVVAACFFVSAAAFAQQDKPTAIYVFVSNPSFTHSNASGDRFDGAFGVALQRMFTPHVSGELTVSRQSETTAFSTFNPDGSLRENHVFTGYSLPVDLTTRYHFFTEGSWKPYAGLGVRWIDGHALGDVTGGVVWQFHRSLGLRFDGKVLVGTTSRFDDRVNGSLGLSWRF